MNTFGFLQDYLSNINKNREVTFKQISINRTPFDSFVSISRNYPDAYILESSVGPRKLSEYSFLGFNPQLKISLKGHNIEINDSDGSKYNHNVDDGIFTDLQKLVNGHATENNLARLVGGFVGYVSYDSVRNWENLPDEKSDDNRFPEYEFGLYNEGLVFDHSNDRTYYYHTARDGIRNLSELLDDIDHADDSVGEIDYTEPKSNVNREEYEEMVRRGKDYISAGDIFQVVLSKKYDLNVKGDLLAFYRTIRKINPSPYMYYLKFGKRQIIGSSPEMLVRVTGRDIETYPIAGTRPRIDEPEKNKVMTEELLADPKENAEHIMLVDLARNDIGKVSEFGSVRVPELKQVHQFSHVQHIVSRVVGKMSKGYDVFDAMRAVFPAGTVSGAPKVRAMEIIDELETRSRGPYAGALGYFSKNGNADFAITIRTLIVDGERASVHAGAGIVADSIPEREWDETEQKVGAILSSLEIASEGI